MRLFRGALICAWLSALAACTPLQPRPELPVDSAIPAGEGGELDRVIADAETRRPGESAFRLVIEGTEAFAIRLHSARLAARSLDVQSYIWHADTTGRFLAHQLIETADRGVKVRLLLDDIDARAKNAGFAALDAHPHIEVRLFNPFASREGTLRFVGEGLTSFGRINRRMHNKSWIADNRVAVVGGRNIGDEYFGASNELNFVDLDFAMIGPIVRDASASFDRYWNSPSAYPMQVLDPDRVSAAALETLRTMLATHAREAAAGKYAAALRAHNGVQRLVKGDWPMEWSPNAAFVSDDPLKVTMSAKDEQRTHVGSALLRAVQAAQTDITVISPYFVPGKQVTTLFTDAARAGTRVRILTNSLAANDVAAVHGGYSRYRKPLLAGGVLLWELKPLGDETVESSVFGSSGASLHTKALAVDGRMAFVGSFNLDPRSTWLNCEQGVLVENTVITTQVQQIFATQTAAKRAWHVVLADGRLSWSADHEVFDSDPHATTGRRFKAWLTRLLRLDAQL